MKLQEVRRICNESTRALWLKGGEELNVAAVNAVIARKENAAAWLRRRWIVLNCILGTVAVGQYVWGLTHDPAWILVGLGAGYVLWSTGWLAFIAWYPTLDKADLAFTRRLRRALEQETEGLGRLRARAARNESFALYLRTFGAETKAMTAWEAKEISDELTNSPTLDYRVQLTLERMASLLEDQWALTHQIVATIASALPVVCLGNINLQDEKRADLATLGVDDVMVVTTDWWQVFQELEATAAFTFVVLDSLTQEISRELDHLMARGRPFIVVSSADVHQRNAVLRAYRAVVEHPAVRHVVVTKENLAPLKTALAAFAPLY